MKRGKDGERERKGRENQLRRDLKIHNVSERKRERENKRGNVHLP